MTRVRLKGNAALRLTPAIACRAQRLLTSQSAQGLSLRGTVAFTLCLTKGGRRFAAKGRAAAGTPPRRPGCQEEPKCTPHGCWDSP
ncbi:unnamed protein product [Mesocestoides corti]|uniref:DUF4236 domain-containing protein n=1 Tax=Mesocestoides corti TaxID=53468 RepID=A0A0R3U8N0_MESCO|nr:unnamed protein product [Mesocestoides corti]